MFQSRPQSAPLNATNQRKSIAGRLSMKLGVSSDARPPFTVADAKSATAADIAIRIGNKNPSQPCVDDRKYTPLHVAAGLGKEDVVKMILAHDNSSLNAVARLGLTPLIVAAGSKQWRIVHLLVAAGADLTLVDSSERNAYDIAMEEKAPETILQVLFPTKSSLSKKSQTSPFSSIVVNESSVSVNLKEEV